MQYHRYSYNGKQLPIWMSNTVHTVSIIRDVLLTTFSIARLGTPKFIQPKVSRLIEESTTEPALKSDADSCQCRNTHLLCLSHDAFLPVCFKIRSLSKGLTPKMDAYYCLVGNPSAAELELKHGKFYFLLLYVYLEE